jgi:Nup85 Nucleoporin
MSFTHSTSAGKGSGAAVTVIFDPKSPATIALPRFDEEEEDAEEKNGGDTKLPSSSLVFSVDRANAGRGVGCNKFESSALISMIDARDAYLNGNNISVGGGDCGGNVDIDIDRHELAALRQLSRNYRLELGDCIDQWTDDKQNRRADNDDMMGGEDDEDDREEMDLAQVQMFYAVIHLSEIYLLIPLSSSLQFASSSSSSSPMGMLGSNDLMATMMGGFADSSFSLDSVEIPGGVSADTVRYLRLHHLGPAEGMFSDEVVETIKTKQQPDQWNNGVDYWKLVMSHAVRGCLDDAWELLTHHSTYRRLEARRQAMTMGKEINEGEEDDYQTQWLRDAERGFEALKCVLLSAPIPAGRNSNTDRDGLSPVDDENDNLTAQRQLQDATEYIEGVPLGAYKMWDKTNSPSFDPQAAYQAFQLWQEALEQVEPLQKLRSRIRPIDQLLSLLAGKFSSDLFESWQEELCADILYVVPNIRPIDMNVRARDAMDNHGSADEAASEFDKLILAIMRGNAGSAIQGLYQILGGDKGAALPAVTVCYCVNVYRTNEMPCIDVSMTLALTLDPFFFFYLFQSVTTCRHRCWLSFSVMLKSWTLHPIASNSARNY